MSIRSKITILFLAIALIPLLLISILTYQSYKKSLEQVYFSRLQDIVTLKAKGIEEYFKELRKHIGRAQSAYIIKQYLPELIRFSSQPKSKEFLMAKEVLDGEWLLKQVDFRSLNIMMLSPAGKIVYATNSVFPGNDFAGMFPAAGKAAFEEGKKRIYLSGIFLDKTSGNKPAVLISAPVFDMNNNFIGVIVFEADLEPIYDLVKDTAGIGGSAEVLIGQKSGEGVIFLTPLKYDSSAILNKTINIGNSLAGPMQKAIQGKEGIGRLIDYRGRDVVAAWRYIPSLGWGIVAKIDANEVFAEVENLKGLMLFILVVISALSVLIAFLIAWSISGPIKKLSSGIERIGSGDLYYKVGTDSNDEVGRLSRSFDKMVHDLKKLSLSADNEHKRFYEVLEMLPVYVVLLSKDYHVPFANRFFRQRFGESGGRRCYEYLFNRDKPCQNCESFKTLKNNSPHHWEWFGPDGRYYDIFDFPFTDTDGSSMILEMGIDITSQKQAQESLLQAFQYSRSLIEISLDPLVTISSEGKITDVNEATIKATGLARKELIGTDFSDYFTEPQKAREGYQQVFAKGFVTDYPLTMRHKDGSLIDVLYNASVYRDTQGNVLGVFAAARDVTVLKRAEKELLLYRDHLEALVAERTQELAKAQAELEKKVFERTSQLLKSNEQLNIEIIERQKIEREIRARNSLLRLAARSASRKDYLDSVVKLLSGWSGAKCVGVRLLNEDGKIPYESYVGFSKRFWERESQLSLKKDKCACIRVVSGEFHPLDAGVVTAGGSFCCGNTAEFIDGLSENERTQFRGECIREGFKSLTIIPMRFKGKIIGAIHFADKRLNLPDPETIGRLESLVMRVAEDTIKFNLFDEILKSNEILERVFSTTNFHIAYMDVNFNFIRVNHAYAVMFNQQPEFFAGKNHFGLYPDDENEEIFRQVVKSAEAYTSFDKPFTYNNGQLGQPVRYYDWSLQPLKDPLGKVEGLILFLVDTTKRKHAEEELIKAQMQLADAKRLSDIGTLAATVAHELRNPLAAIQMASYNIRRKAQNPLLDKHLLTVENKVNESEQIISNLLFYSRLKSPQYEDVDIYGLINECVKLARQRFLKERVSFSADLSAIKNIPFEADPLQMKEVFSNILNNAYESQRKDGRRVELRARVNNGYINLIIQDSGEGIGKDDLEKVFDPFFTTKAKGTGLGLTVCKQVVNMHGGGIGIESEKGKGTTVTVVLPVKKVS